MLRVQLQPGDVHHGDTLTPRPAGFSPNSSTCRRPTPWPGGSRTALQSFPERTTSSEADSVHDSSTCCSAGVGHLRKRCFGLTLRIPGRRPPPVCRRCCGFVAVMPERPIPAGSRLGGGHAASRKASRPWSERQPLCFCRSDCFSCGFSLSEVIPVPGTETTQPLRGRISC